jgi:hypothetical protein
VDAALGGNVNVAVTPGAAASVTTISGGQQVTPEGLGLPSPLKVQIFDQFGNAVPGVTVTFAAAAGVTFSNGASQMTQTTDASGQAKVSGTATFFGGNFTVTARVSGVATAASFSLTNAGATVTAVWSGTVELVYAVYSQPASLATDLYLFRSDVTTGPQLLATGILSAETFVEPSGAVGSDVVYTNHDCYLFLGGPPIYLGGGVLSASTAFNSQGQPISDVVYTNNTMYQFGPGNVTPQQISSTALAVALAIDPAGQQFLQVVGTDTSLTLSINGGTPSTIQSTGMQSVSIAFDPLGQELVYAIFTNLQLWQFGPGPGSEQLITTL